MVDNVPCTSSYQSAVYSLCVSGMAGLVHTGSAIGTKLPVLKPPCPQATCGKKGEERVKVAAAEPENAPRGNTDALVFQEGDGWAACCGKQCVTDL